MLRFERVSNDDEIFIYQLFSINSGCYFFCCEVHVAVLVAVNLQDYFGVSTLLKIGTARTIGELTQSSDSNEFDGEIWDVTVGEDGLKDVGGEDEGGGSGHDGEVEDEGGPEGKEGREAAEPPQDVGILATRLGNGRAQLGITQRSDHVK